MPARSSIMAYKRWAKNKANNMATAVIPHRIKNRIISCNDLGSIVKYILCFKVDSSYSAILLKDYNIILCLSFYIKL